MKYFDEHPKVVQVLIGLLAICLFSLGAMTFYRYASSPTDENWFRNSSSTLYFVKNLSGNVIKKSSYKPFVTYASYGPDSICIGDLLVSVNDLVPASPSEVDAVVKKNAGDSLVITVDRSTENALVSFKMKKTDFSSGTIRVIPPTAYVST